jgi:hypothetical protein
VGVEQSRAESGDHAGAAVGAGAAADAHHDLGASRIERRGEDLAEPAARRGHRFPLALGQSPQPRHIRHLDDRGPASARIRGLDRSPGGTGSRDWDAGEPGRDRGVDGPVAPVGDGDSHDVDVRHPPDPGGHRRRDLRSG